MFNLSQEILFEQIDGEAGHEVFVVVLVVICLLADVYVGSSSLLG